MRQTVIDCILKHKLVVIMRGLSEAQALQTAEALYAGGVRLVEVTYSEKTPYEETERIIKRLQERFGKKMCIGAGTVTNLERLESAIRGGAKYIISPNVKAEVIKKTVQSGLVSLPGALTPTEVTEALEAGADFVKIFPVSAMGRGYIKDLLSPFDGIRLVAVGGVDEENLTEFLKQGAVGVGVGGNIIKKKLIESGDFKAITRLAEAYVKTIQNFEEA